MPEEFSPGKLLRPKDAARLLGLSERWVRNRLADGSLPVVRLRGATRIALSDLEQFVESGRKAPAKCSAGG